jgi:hypothetical protein
MLLSNMHATTTILFDGAPLVTTVADDVITAGIPPALVSVPGRHWIQVIDPAFNVSTAQVPFDVISP